LILEVKDLKTSFSLSGYKESFNAVDGVSFTLNKGETLGLVGESGSGKTTTALSLMRLLPQNGKISEGSIKLLGKDIVSMDEQELMKTRWKDISIIFQGAMNSLNPVLTIGEQIKEAILLHEKIDEKSAKTRVKQLFEKVEIDSKRILQYPHEFSGGMRQRAMIAMALACNPKLIIGDEPTTALDVMVQSQIFYLLENLRKEMDLSMILITHDLSVLGDTCDKAAIMYGGKIVEIGTVEELYYNAKHPYTKILLSSFPDVKKERRLPESIKGNPPSLINPPKGCRFHPRCPMAKEICSLVEPPTVVQTQTHNYSCHFGGL
jgi:peptide/nickel transport system ATP-binding protein